METAVPFGAPDVYTTASIHDISVNPGSAVESGGYKGAPGCRRNQPANIPHTLNCALFITGLPPDISPHDLLGMMRHVGKVYAMSIQRPDDTYATCAAKVVMWDKASATRLKFQIVDEVLSIPGYQLGVKLNRIRAAAQRPSQQSRVLRVCGDPAVVNESYLLPFLQETMGFDLDEVIALHSAGDHTRIEIRFASFRCQAELAYKKLTRDERVKHKLQVEYAPDPCA